MGAPIPLWVVAGRIIAIIGMSFAAAVGILGVVGPVWSWAIFGAITFWPFLLLIVVVERYSSKQGWIGPEANAPPEP